MEHTYDTKVICYIIIVVLNYYIIINIINVIIILLLKYKYLYDIIKYYTKVKIRTLMIKKIHGNLLQHLVSETYLTLRLTVAKFARIVSSLSTGRIEDKDYKFF